MKKHFYDVEAKARAKKYQCWSRKLPIQEEGILLAKKQFRDNDTSGESQSHRKDDGASPMWAGFPPVTCEDIFNMFINESLSYRRIFIDKHIKK
ncbi:hypothetical protein AALB52_14470 [Lachnospiraceae bacterium 38-14]